MDIILITPEGNFQNEHTLINSFFEAGLPTLHIRKPSFSELELEQYLKKIDETYYERIILHQHFTLVDEFDLKGYHLKEAIRKNVDFGALNLNKSLSASYHDIEELKSASDKLDYVFLSPIFKSISKKGYPGKFDLFDVKETLPQLDTKVFALGGVQFDKKDALQFCGFQGMCLLGDIWYSSEPIESLKRYLRYLPIPSDLDLDF